MKLEIKKVSLFIKSVVKSSKCTILGAKSRFSVQSSRLGPPITLQLFFCCSYVCGTHTNMTHQKKINATNLTTNGILKLKYNNDNNNKKKNWGKKQTTTTNKIFIHFHHFHLQWNINWPLLLCCIKMQNNYWSVFGVIYWIICYTLTMTNIFYIYRT